LACVGGAPLRASTLRRVPGVLETQLTVVSKHTANGIAAAT
jgi:hypothetical protein